MAIQITGKNIDLTDALKEYVAKKVAEFEKYNFDLIDVDVEMDRSRHHKKGEDVHHVRINVKIPNDLLHAQAEEADMYAAIDVCRDDIERQLRKVKTTYAAKQRASQQAQRDMKSAV